MPTLKRGGTETYLEFSFTQEERDNILKYCSLRVSINKRFRKIVAAGSDITVLFNRPEATEMLSSFSQAAMNVSEDKDIKNMFNDLYDRFKAKYNDVFHK